MANLIITVISIALVAVAALMGAYYGGQAFMDGQVRADANTLIKQAEQIKSAYLMYLAEGNDPFAAQQYIDTDAMTSSGKYLSTAPRYKNQRWILNRIPPLSDGSGKPEPPRISMSAIKLDVCKRLAEIFTGLSEPALITNNDSTWAIGQDSQGRTALSRLTTYGADCYYHDANSNTTPDDGEMVFHMMIKR